MNNFEIYIAIFIMVLVNYFTRAFPFLFFNKKQLPSYLIFIAKYFPAIIMSILIVYTLKDVDFRTEFYGLKEIVSILFTAILHLVFKNYLVSIFLGTLSYMVLAQYF